MDQKLMHELLVLSVLSLLEVAHQRGLPLSGLIDPAAARKLSQADLELIEQRLKTILRTPS